MLRRSTRRFRTFFSKVADLLNDPTFIVDKDFLILFEHHPKYALAMHKWPSKVAGFQMEAIPSIEHERRWISMEIEHSREVSVERNFIKFKPTIPINDLNAFKKLLFWIQGGCAPMKHHVRAI